MQSTQQCHKYTFAPGARPVLSAHRTEDFRLEDYLPMIKQAVRRRYKSGRNVSISEFDDYVQAVFLKLYERKDHLLSNFDPNKGNIEQFMYKSISYALRESSRDMTTQDNKNHLAKQAIRNSADDGNSMKHSEIRDDGVYNRSFKSSNAYPANYSFCYDLQNKVRKAFVKSLKAPERRSWKLFLKYGFTCREVARKLGVSVGAAVNLRKSIENKAKYCLEGYDSGLVNFN